MSSGGASSSGGGGGFLTKLKALDAYPKINEDFFTKTMSGGIITIVASVVMVLLFLSELRESRAMNMKGLESSLLAARLNQLGTFAVQVYT